MDERELGFALKLISSKKFKSAWSEDVRLQVEAPGLNIWSVRLALDLDKLEKLMSSGDGYA